MEGENDHFYDCIADNRWVGEVKDLETDGC